MAMIKGTNGNDKITPGEVSPEGVVAGLRLKPMKFTAMVATVRLMAMIRSIMVIYIMTQMATAWGIWLYLPN